MLFKKKEKTLSVGWVILGMGLMTGCTKASEDASGTVQMAGKLDIQSASQSKALSMAVSAQAVSNYEVYCVTFTQPPIAGQSAVDAEGNFALSMPASTPFGCFVNDLDSKKSVATLTVSGSDTGFGSTATTNLNLIGNVNLGELHLDLEKGEVVIPKEILAPVQAPVAESKIDLDEMHNSTYKLSCIKSGDAELDKRCVKDLQEGDDDNSEVFFRIINASRNGKAIKGLGVWESQTRFNDCCGIDLTDAKVADLAVKDAISFPVGGIVTGAAFSIDEILCPLRNPTGGNEHENVQKYYTIGELVQDASGYTLYAHDFSQANNDCQEENTTVVHFSGKSADKMIGQLFSKTKYYANVQGACDHLLEYEREDNFLIELKKLK